jgi:hypothetical protein
LSSQDDTIVGVDTAADVADLQACHFTGQAGRYIYGGGVDEFIGFDLGGGVALFFFTGFQTARAHDHFVEELVAFGEADGVMEFRSMEGNPFRFERNGGDDEYCAAGCVDLEFSFAVGGRTELAAFDAHGGTGDGTSVFGQDFTSKSL